MRGRFGWARRALAVVVVTVVALAAGARPALAAPDGYTLIAAGESHSCTVSRADLVYCWGENSDGQLGDGNAPTDQTTAVPVDTSGALDGKFVTQVVAGGTHTCALDDEGDVYCWGGNASGQLGTGGPGGGSDVPVHVGAALAGKTVEQVVAGVDHTCALDSDGVVYCWGADGQGQLGDDAATADQATPVAVDVGVTSSLNGRTVTAITASRFNTCALDTAGDAHCWGDDLLGQLGNGGAATDSGVPVAVDTSGVLAGKTLKQIDIGGEVGCAVDTLGAAYCWGENFAGELGDGNMGTDSTVPVAVSVGVTSSLNGKTVVQVDAGQFHACALDSAGAVHCWGENASGQLGNGAAPADVDEPDAVVGALPASSAGALDIDTSFQHTCAVTEDAVVFCWGDNSSGQLGNSSLVPADEPVAVAGLPVPPDPPTGVNVTPGNRSLRVAWRAPADLGTGTLITYAALALPPGSFLAQAGASTAQVQALADFGGSCGTSALTCTIQDLTNGSTYEVAVFAISTDGASEPSQVVTGRPSASGAGAGLAVTGKNVTAYVLTGGGLVGSGLILLTLLRRRRIRWVP